MKYLFITFKVQNGEYTHIHRVLHETKAENIQFAAQRYVSSFWGRGQRENNYWWFFGEIVAELKFVQEISKPEYDFLSNLFVQGL